MNAQVIQFKPADEVTIAVAATVTGLSEKAIRMKIEVGKWLEGREYFRRDGGVYISLPGVSKWVRGVETA